MAGTAHGVGEGRGVRGHRGLAALGTEWGRQTRNVRVTGLPGAVAGLAGVPEVCSLPHAAGGWFSHRDTRTQQGRRHARLAGGRTGRSPGRRTHGATETGVPQGQQLKAAFVLETCL